MEQRKGQHDQQRRHDELEQADVVGARLGKNLQQVGLRHRRARHDHRKRRVHARDVVQRAIRHVGHAQAQQEAQQPQRHRDDGGRAQRLEKALYGKARAAGKGQHAVRPHQQVECRDDGGQVEHALGAEHRVHQRNAHEAAVGIDHREAFDHRVVPAVLSQAQVGHQHRDAKAQQRQAEGLPEALEHLHVKVPLVGHEDHHRADHQHQQVGQVLAALLGHHVRLVGDDARHHEDQHQQNLIEDHGNIL